MYSIILSYPRCGSNFLWYCISDITSIQCGKSHAQNIEFWQSKDDYKLIFMIRSYKECIPRQIDSYIFDDTFRSQISNSKPNSDLHIFDYISTLEYYEKFEGQKLVVYYEDLILDTKSVLIKIIKFLLNEIDDDIKKEIDKFIENIEYHKIKSSERYNSLTPLGCQSLIGKDIDIFFHSKKMKKSDLLLIDEYLKFNYQYLYEKYLIRYSELPNQ